MKNQFTTNDLTLFSESFGEVLIKVDGLFHSDNKLDNQIHEALHAVNGRFGIYEFCREIALKIEEVRKWSNEELEEDFIDMCDRMTSEALIEFIKKL